MSKKSLLILLMALNSWLPWTREARTLLRDKQAIVIFTGEPSYARGQCCGSDFTSFLINSNCGPDALPMVILHETQHLLFNLYVSEFTDGRYEYLGNPQNGERFTRLVMACSKKVAPQRLRSITKFAGLGPVELHAQLPWLLKGNLCPELQPWYPWFGLKDRSNLTGCFLSGRCPAVDN